MTSNETSKTIRAYVDINGKLCDEQNREIRKATPTERSKSACTAEGWIRTTVKISTLKRRGIPRL